MAMLNNQMVSRMLGEMKDQGQQKKYGAWRSDHTLHAASKRFESFVPWGGSGRSVKQKGGNVGNPWKPEKWHFFWWFFISESPFDGGYVDFLASRSHTRLHGRNGLPRWMFFGHGLNWIRSKFWRHMGDLADFSPSNCLRNCPKVAGVGGKL